MELNGPDLLFRLPRTARSDGAPSFGPVWGLRDGVKRRRKELCAAIDGDSIGIHEIQTGKILTSYPVPPASSFSGPPCSIRTTDGDGNIRRKTYFAARRPALCVESFETAGNEAQIISSDRSSELQDQDSAVLHLEVLGRDKGSEVLVVQENGAITLLSEDLKNQLWRRDVSRGSQSQPLRLLAIQSMTRPEAQKSILKQRPDMLSKVDHDSLFFTVAFGQVATSDAGAADIQSIYYGVWALDMRHHHQTAPTAGLQPLFDHELQLASKDGTAVNPKHLFVRYNSSATQLFVRSGNEYAAFDLTSVIPSRTSSPEHLLHDCHDIIAVSSAFALCSFRDSLRLLDLKFDTTQAQIDLSRLGLKRKRHRMSSDLSAPIEFITYYPHMMRVIGRRRNQIVTIDISSTKQSLESGTKLFDNIALRREQPSPNVSDYAQKQNVNLGTISRATASDAEWLGVKRRLDQLVQAGNVNEFEKIFGENVTKQSRTSSSQAKTIDGLPAHRGDIPDIKLNYLLSKIFQMTPGSDQLRDDVAPPDRRLTVAFTSFKLIQWLAKLGLLNKRRLEIAIEASPLQSSDALDASSISKALFEADSSLVLLSQCLKNGFSVYVEEQAAAVQILVQHARHLDSHLQKQTSHEQSEMQSQMLSTGASGASGLPRRVKNTLVTALNRLGSSPSAKISMWLRQLFTQEEIITLIQIVRQQLFQGGHLGLTGVAPGASESKGTVNLDAIIRVLSSCVDAIGPIGFVGAQDDPGFLEMVIPHLVSEINLAKQALEDVLDLQGVLRETLRYHESWQQKQMHGHLLHGKKGTDPEQVPGTIVTVYSEGLDGGDSIGDGLPLSLKADQMIDPFKTRKGGGQVSRRSKQQMNMLQEREKGQYSFERLVL